MANVLTQDKQKAVLRQLTEGMSIRATSRITGVHKCTIAKLVVRFGNASREFLDDQMQGLTLRHVQVDEQHSYVGKRQKNLTDAEKDRHDIGEIYTWTCFDHDTKLVPTFAVGKRSADMARRLMVDLRKRLVLPNPHASDDHNWSLGHFRPVTQISTDGFAGYPEAVDLAFGPYVKYGVIIKDYRNADLKPGNYSPAEMVASDRRLIRGMEPSEAWSICTSHVERHNLTVRTFMKRFNRLTICFSKKLENHAAAVAMFMAYYNYVWRTRYPDKSGRSGKLRPTAAMMAGVTDRLWRFDDLYEAVVKYL